MMASAFRRQGFAMAKRVLVFDMDGTLTAARQKIKPDMRAFLEKVRASGTPLALVGGSDLNKITEQMNGSFDDVTSRFDYLFSENGVVGFKGCTPYPVLSIGDKLGEERLQNVINFCLHYIADLKLPAKRGNFIEFRKSMLNVSPVGRSCSQVEREAFLAFDNENHVRKKMIEELKQRFPTEDYGLQYSIGGQISIDVFPIGWDKSYCLQRLVDDGYTDIHFFGDKTMPGGNDHEIFIDPRTIGHTVTGPDDTKKQVSELLGL